MIPLRFMSSKFDQHIINVLIKISGLKSTAPPAVAEDLP